LEQILIDSDLLIFQPYS